MYLASLLSQEQTVAQLQLLEANVVILQFNQLLIKDKFKMRETLK